jgi:hypothetical protein
MKHKLNHLSRRLETVVTSRAEAGSEIILRPNNRTTVAKDQHTISTLFGVTLFSIPVVLSM